MQSHDVVLIREFRDWYEHNWGNCYELPHRMALSS